MDNRRFPILSTELLSARDAYHIFWRLEAYIDKAGIRRPGNKKLSTTDTEEGVSRLLSCSNTNWLVRNSAGVVGHRMIRPEDEERLHLHSGPKVRRALAGFAPNHAFTSSPRFRKLKRTTHRTECSPLLSLVYSSAHESSTTGF